MKIDKLTPGKVVYDVGTVKMGNTSLTTVTVWSVAVKSVDHATRTVVASWNGNAPRTYREHQWKKWREKKPLLIKSGLGYRLAKREEIKAASAGT